MHLLLRVATYTSTCRVTLGWIRLEVVCVYAFTSRYVTWSIWGKRMLKYEFVYVYNNRPRSSKVFLKSGFAVARTSTLMSITAYSYTWLSVTSVEFRSPAIDGPLLPTSSSCGSSSKHLPIPFSNLTFLSFFPPLCICIQFNHAHNYI